jgi:catechol 2,3-dioxygenase-like lactoylglutathione lyase family enzyme
MPPLTGGLHHLTIRTTDLARAKRFYIDTMGFQAVRERDGAVLLNTEPKDHRREIRAYIRDPDGHLIEVGQSTGILR